MIGDILKAKREEFKLTQTELARIAGISQAEISRLENGSRFPRLETVRKLLEVFGPANGNEVLEFRNPSMKETKIYYIVRTGHFKTRDGLDYTIKIASDGTFFTVFKDGAGKL